MDLHKSKGRLLLLVIFAMTALPFSIAWLQGGRATLIQGKTNKGQLINPVIATKRVDLIGLDAFSANNIGEMRGHWLMVNLIPHDDCNFECLEAIHKSRQLLLMMNKDLTRIRRVVVFFHPTSPETAEQWLGDDKILLKVKPSSDFTSKINDILHGNINDGQLFLMDPMGNLMMHYEPGFDPYKVKSDLMHLLRISQIG